MHSTGFWVPWTVAASWSLPEMCHSVVCFRSPAQWPLPVFFTAYQQGVDFHPEVTHLGA